MERAETGGSRQQSHPAYISNLPYEIATSQLDDLIRSEVHVKPVRFDAHFKSIVCHLPLETYLTVCVQVNVEILQKGNPSRRTSSGLAVVTFSTAQDMQTCIKRLHNTDVMGRSLLVRSDRFE